MKRPGSFFAALPSKLLPLTLVLVPLLLVLTHRDAATQLLDTLGQYPPTVSIPVFLLLFALATLCMVPVSLFLIAAGALFGMSLGAVVGMAGFAVSAAVTAACYRYLASELVLRHVPPTLRNLGGRGYPANWQLVAVLRLQPVIPAFLINPVLGLTSVRLRDIFWATGVFGAPAGLLMVYTGSTGRELLVTDTPRLLSLAGMAVALLLLLLLTRLGRSKVLGRALAQDDLSR